MVKKNSNINTSTILEINVEHIYYILVGKKEDLEKFIKDNNNTNNYLLFKINIPLTVQCEQLEKSIGKSIHIEPSIESAHCYTYGDGFPTNSYILMELVDDLYSNKKKLVFPFIDINNDINSDDSDSNEEDVEVIIENEIKKRFVKIPPSIKKSLRPISIVGYNEDILVYASKVNYRAGKTLFSPKQKL